MENGFEEPFSAAIPYDSLYQASRKEASRKKPVFFIHKYFARRITANYRLAMLGYMAEAKDDLLKQYYSSSQKREDITVLDPFMGGGTTVFEALRFGCKVIGSDLQPLSLFVTRALIEPVDEKAVRREVKKLENRIGLKIKSFYKTTCPCCDQDADGMYSFHVKKAKTTSSCHEHRFFSSFVIAYKKNQFTVVCPKCGELSKTDLKGTFRCKCGWELDDPRASYIKGGKFTCPDCGESKVLSDYDENSGYPFETDVVAIEYHCPHCGSHDYKAPDDKDLALRQRAIAEYKELEGSLPIPNQTIPVGYNTNQIRNHGYRKFSDLFCERQLLCLGLLLNEINKTEDKQVQLWLQLAFSGMLEMNSMFCRYQQNAYKICNIFFNHAYVPISMPVENCVWGAKLGTGTFIKTIQKVLRGKQFNTNIYDLAAEKNSKGKYDSIKKFSDDMVTASSVNDYEELDGKHPLLMCSDSRRLEAIPDGSIDLVLTDPPYGANVMYSELIDFFHVWNYMSSISSELGFTEPLSPKTKEIIINPIAGKDANYYKSGLTEVLSECNVKLKNSGYLVFSFHDKSIESWLAVLESISSARFSLKMCYPVQSETRTGAHTSNKNSIGIDIMLVCKKGLSHNSSNSNIETILEQAAESARKELIKSLDRLRDVEAEITLPDAQNILIANYFSRLPSDVLIDEESKDKALLMLNNILLNLQEIESDYTITEKRSGWWSELYKKKWDLS